MCWEIVDWDELPDHVADHDQDIEIEVVGVQGDRPDVVTLGEPTEDESVARLSWITYETTED